MPNKMMLLLLLSLLLLSAATAASYGNNNNNNNHLGSMQQPDKLLVVVIGGLRWDHMKLFESRSRRGFPGFTEFYEGGVRTEYLKSVFPAEDFPAWRSISTGRYPGNHGIIGNQFYDPTPLMGYRASSQSQGSNMINSNSRRPPVKYFNYEDERTTGEIRWWEKAKPIWATAKEQGINFTTLLWSRCDIKWFGTKTTSPSMCEPFYARNPSKILAIMLETALGHFQEGISDAALIYEYGLKEEAEESGPLSGRVEHHLGELDKAIRTFFRRLREVNMDQSVNVVIMSDHGMTYGSDSRLAGGAGRVSVKKVHMGRLLRRVSSKVRRVVGSGAYSMVWPRDDRFTQDIVFELRRHAGQDYQVYTREELPEHLHWKNKFNTPPILVLAHNGTVLLRAGSHLQRPLAASSSRRAGTFGAHDTAARILEQTRLGISGYDPEEEDMRGVFMARGPGFHDTGATYEPIELVDVYGMFCHLLGINPEENDGVWDRIRKLLRNSGSLVRPSLAMTTLATLATVRHYWH